jgi:hypothetical protein
MILIIPMASSQENVTLENASLAYNPQDSAFIGIALISALNLTAGENASLDTSLNAEASVGFGSQNYRSDALEGEVFDIPDGVTSEIPDFENLSLLGLIYVDALNVLLESGNDSFPGIGKSNWFAVRYGGKFNIDKEGSYNFRLISDDGSRLLIDGATVVDNDGIHTIRSRSGQVYLQRGIHEIEVDYFQAGQDAGLQLFVTPPGGYEEIFRPGYGAVDHYNAMPLGANETEGITILPIVNWGITENRSILSENASPAENRTNLIGAVSLIENRPRLFFEGANLIEFQPNLFEGASPVGTQLNMLAGGSSNMYATSSISVGGISPMSDAMPVNFYSIPGGAKITIDKTSYGKTPSVVRVDPGKSHNYSIVKSGYRPCNGTISGHQNAMIQATLEPNKK